MKQIISIPLSTAKLSLFVLFNCLSGCAHEAEVTLGEVDVKIEVEKAAEIWICSDEVILENTGIESSECPREVSRFADGCWHMLDKLDFDYELAQNKAGRKRFCAIGNVYNHCVEAEIWITKMGSRSNQK